MAKRRAKRRAAAKACFTTKYANKPASPNPDKTRAAAEDRLRRIREMETPEGARRWKIVRVACR
jgi:hypothetical protein